MNHFTDFFRYVRTSVLASHSHPFERALQKLDNEKRHGNRDRWEELLQSLPPIAASEYDLQSDAVKIGSPSNLEEDQKHELRRSLQLLHPWRKGPFSFFGIDIDTEWRSDLKWNRLTDHIRPLHGRAVLDVGCGSGYHCWRMLGEGAQSVVGIDPGQLFWFQFLVAKHFLPAKDVHFLPIPLEEFPEHTEGFDTVFSMGVLYHRKAPFEHLERLKGCLKRGGELVLETLVVPGDESTVFVPPGRYAQMRNVFFIPSPAALVCWLQKAGFSNIRVADVTKTTHIEQRQTEWMTFHSLGHFLDPNDVCRTIEGHPAPTRAVLIAEK